MYGYLVDCNRIYQVTDHPKSKHCSTGIFVVEENTIGQYTGLKDKNGNKIFEGDIIKYKQFHTQIDICDKVIYDGAEGAFMIKRGADCMFVSTVIYLAQDGLEIIGNIY